MAEKSIRVSDLRDSLKGCAQEIAAELLGESVRTVRTKLKTGEYRGSGKGKVDAFHALQAQRYGRKTPAVAVETARLKRAQADRFELDNKIRRGELLSRDLVDEVVTVTMSTVAQMVDSLSRRLPPLVAGASDPAVVQARIREETNAIRNEVSKHLRMLAGQGK